MLHIHTFESVCIQLGIYPGNIVSPMTSSEIELIAAEDCVANVSRGTSKHH